MEEEKRGARRIIRPLVARYSADSDDEDRKWDMAKIKNISEKGICFSTSRYFSLGQSLAIDIRIPIKPAEWAEFKGRVVACDKINPNLREADEGIYLLRVEFLDLNDYLKELVHQYIGLF